MASLLFTSITLLLLPVCVTGECVFVRKEGVCARWCLPYMSCVLSVRWNPPCTDPAYMRYRNGTIGSLCRQKLTVDCQKLGINDRFCVGADSCFFRGSLFMARSDQATTSSCLNNRQARASVHTAWPWENAICCKAHRQSKAEKRSYRPCLNHAWPGTKPFWRINSLM